MIEEIFKDIKGFENLYQVSNLGNIKSLPKKHNLRKKNCLNSKGFNCSRIQSMFHFLESEYVKS
jgi:hypothetical protein